MNTTAKAMSKGAVGAGTALDNGEEEQYQHEVQASYGAEEDYGLMWSLQTIGIPDPIRQYFQSLDHAALLQMEPVLNVTDHWLMVKVPDNDRCHITIIYDKHERKKQSKLFSFIPYGTIYGYSLSY